MTLFLIAGWWCHLRNYRTREEKQGGGGVGVEEMLISVLDLESFRW